MNLRIFVVLFFFFVSQICFSQTQFEQKIDELKAHPLMKGAMLGVDVYGESSDSALFEFNRNISMIPASTLKLVTSATALEILSPQYHFSTKLVVTGNVDSSTKTLNGDLYIIGGGDPALGSEYFKEYYFTPDFLDCWADSLFSLGIEKVNGNIFIDESIYDEKVIPDKWIWEDIGNYFGAGARGISVYDNMFRITFKSPKKSGSPAEIVKVDPWAEWMEIENHVISSDKNSDNAYVYGDPWGGIRKVSGTIPKSRKNFQIKASLPEPGLALGNQLKSKLDSKNIFVSGQILKKEFKGKAVKYFEILSPPLSEIIKVLNYESVNLFAEHLVKQIAFEETGLGSTEAGIKIIKDFWAEKGIDTDGMFLEDGSGLSHFNSITPNQLVDVLYYMKTGSQNFESFKATLPGPGEGSLYYFDPANFPGKSLQCKSGSMTRVRCYGGFMKTDSGEELIFSIMVNNFSMSHSDLIEKIEELLLVLRESY